MVMMVMDRCSVQEEDTEGQVVVDISKRMDMAAVETFFRRSTSDISESADLSRPDHLKESGGQ